MYDPEIEHEPFVYTIGVSKTFGHAELAIFDRDPEQGHAILSNVVQMIGEGLIISDNETVAGVLAGPYQLAARAVLPEFLGDYFGTAQRYFRREDVPVLVLFWPDRNHRFPFEPDYELEAQIEASKIVGAVLN